MEKGEKEIYLMGGAMYKYLILAFWYGFLEAIIYKNGFRSGKKIIFGKFAVYHLALLIGALILLGSKWKYLPLMILIEDISFFLYSPKTLNETSWINLWFGGFRILGRWIPFTYIILIGMYLFLETLF